MCPNFVFVSFAFFVCSGIRGCHRGRGTRGPSRGGGGSPGTGPARGPDSHRHGGGTLSIKEKEKRPKQKDFFISLTWAEI